MSEKEEEEIIDSLIKQYVNSLLRVRELYMQIENKLIKEHNATIGEVSLILDKQYKDALKSLKNNNTNTNSSNNNTTNIQTNNNNNIFQHFQ